MELVRVVPSQQLPLRMKSNNIGVRQVLGHVFSANWQMGCRCSMPETCPIVSIDTQLYASDLLMVRLQMKLLLVFDPTNIFCRPDHATQIRATLNKAFNCMQWARHLRANNTRSTSRVMTPLRCGARGLAHGSG